MIGSKGRLAWVLSRLVLYTAVAVTGFAIAGIIGTTKLNEKGSTCLLNTEVSAIPPEECCTRFACQSCKKQEDCDTSFESTCTGGFCQPDHCFASSGAKNTQRCKYVIIFASVSGAFALLMISINVYKACNKAPEALKVTGMSVPIGIATLCLAVCALAMAAVITAGFNDLCKSFEKNKDVLKIQSCADGYKGIYTLKGNKHEFPDFYSKLSAAMVMGWVNTLALVFLGATSISRYYCNRKKAGYSISAEDHHTHDSPTGEEPSHIFSETEEDDAQLITS